MPERLQAVWSYWTAGGWLLIPLAIISFLIWYQYLAWRRRLLDAIGPAAYDPGHVDVCLEHMAPPEAMVTLASTPGASARLARQVLLRVQAGLAPGEALDQCRSAEIGPFQQAFLPLAALVAAAPLVGLLGTVLGMIATFTGVAGQGASTHLVADGISQALITTQVGLIVALPGSFGLAHLCQLRRRLTNDLDRCGSYLLLWLPAGKGAP